MTRTYTFRDSEVRALPLRALNWAGARFARTRPVLDADRICAAARSAAGRDDLGGDSYREPLERYVEALNAEAELTTFGRFATRQMLVKSLATRARLHAYEAQHPEVRSERLTAPWVIVGLPRTGTTLLSYLLGLDPMARAPLHWEADDPAPPPTLATAAEDPRIATSAAQYAQLVRMNPCIQAMHPFGATLAQECVAFFMYDLRTLGMETQAYVPSYGRWLRDCDMAPAYAQHQRALRVLQSTQPTERWVLKTPNHLWCLPTLFETYPDARVLWTHRHPGRVVTSLASLVNALQRTFSTRRDPLPVAEEWREKAHCAIERGMAFDRTREDGWCCHVRYGDLTADPIATVRRIYAHFGDSPSPLHERRMAAWMRDRPQETFGRHAYDPGDFGWSYDQLDAEFAAYREAFDVGRE